MRKIFTILFSVMLVLSSCDRAFENGELDGMWRLERVVSDDSELLPQNVYYSFQRHIVMLGRYYEEQMPHLYMAKFACEGSLLEMSMFKEYPGGEDICDSEVLESFCIYNPEGVVFVIERLNDEVLIMQSDSRKYFFRKW